MLCCSSPCNLTSSASNLFVLRQCSPLLSWCEDSWQTRGWPCPRCNRTSCQRHLLCCPPGIWTPGQHFTKIFRPPDEKNYPTYFSIVMTWWKCLTNIPGHSSALDKTVRAPQLASAFQAPWTHNQTKFIKKISKEMAEKETKENLQQVTIRPTTASSSNQAGGPQSSLKIQVNVKSTNHKMSTYNENNKTRRKCARPERSRSWLLQTRDRSWVLHCVFLQQTAGRLSSLTWWRPADSL